MDFIKDEKTKSLLNKLARKWKNLPDAEKKKFGSFEGFVESELKPLAFSERCGIERLLISWFNSPQLRRDFSDDFSVYAFFELNTKNNDADKLLNKKIVEGLL
ncbi:MAG: hypothetical protein JRJ62_03300 [Deltaproteobacteria bacterium]|nr:hypothetical protein [Deltaproteobacteria bacterium]